MRIAVVGASGNIGTSLLDALGSDPEVTSVVGIARRPPQAALPKVEWATADVVDDDLVPLLRGADAVVVLAWLIQPSRDLNVTWQTNVVGSMRVFRAAAEAGSTAIVYSSSVGAYSAGPKDRAVGETWPTDGVPTSAYGREKAYVERALDAFELEHPEIRVVRMRPAFVLKREAASQVRRLFLGPFFPSPLLRPGLLPVVPDNERLRFQVVLSRDVGQAFRLAVVRPVRGAFNLAAEPVVDGRMLARALLARRLDVPAAALRALTDLSWRLRLHPVAPGWIDLVLGLPIMDTTRARTELRWAPEHDAAAALAEVLEGMRHGAARPTPPLEKGAGGRARVREVLSGVGARDRA